MPDCFEPVVSVIIPVYNSEKYIQECLDSILAQTMKNIEIICVDDGSSDGSPEILEKYAVRTDRMVIHQQSHRGVSAARNAGLRLARGKYVYFMDSDDTVHPEMLERITKRAEMDDLDITYFNGRAFTEKNEFQEIVYEQNALMDRSHKYEGIYPGEELMVAMYRNREYWMTQWLQLYRRSFLWENNLLFNEGIIHEDNLFTFVCMLSAKRCGYVDEIFYEKRIRPDSITTKKAGFDNVYGYFICHIKMKEFLVTKGYKGRNPAAEAIMYSMLDEGRRIYAGLNNDERYRYYSLPYDVQVLFKISVADYVGYVETMIRPEASSGEALHCGGMSGGVRDENLLLHTKTAPEKHSLQSGLVGWLRRQYRIIRKIFHGILPSSRYNVTWSYQHLTAQLQLQTQMLSHLLSMDYFTRMGIDSVNQRLEALEKKKATDSSIKDTDSRHPGEK